MINNFEYQTSELTSDELKLVHWLVNGLKLRDKSNPIKAPKIVTAMNIFAEKNGLVKMNDVRLRKLVNYIRSNSILPVIATSKGYYTSYDEKELSDQILSLEQRSRSILDCAYGLRKILKENIQIILEI